MITELMGIQRNIDKADRTDRRVQNLASYINVDTLKAVHKKTDGRKAVGIDKVTKEEYSKRLDENLRSLVERMKRGSYRLQPSKRVYIPKDGKGGMRPLGISSYEDKLVEAVIAEILAMVMSQNSMISATGSDLAGVAIWQSGKPSRTYSYIKQAG